MIDLTLSDDAWDGAVTAAGGDARLLLRGLLAMSPCVVRKVLEGAGADFAMLSKRHPVTVLADAALKAALSRYGDGRPVESILQDDVAELTDRLWRRHRADMRRLNGPGGIQEMLRMNRRRKASIFSAPR